MGKKFNVGDKVRVKDNYYDNSTRGKVGVIVKPNKFICYDYEVEFDKSYNFTHIGTHGRDRYRYFYERELELVESVNETKPTTKYKPGDEVTVKSDLTYSRLYKMADGTNRMPCTNQMCTKRGKKVKIKSVTKTGKYMIEGSIFPWVDEMFEEPVIEPKLVCFANFKKDGKLYTYLTDDTSITVGSDVLVPVYSGSKSCKVKVMRIGYYYEDELDVPFKDMKKVIEKVETPIKEEDIPMRVAFEKGVLTLSVDLSEIK